VHAELRDEAGQNAIESAFVEETRPNQFVEAIDAVRGPLAPRFHDDVALRSLEFHSEDFGNNHFGRRFPARGQL
jgi:hypothetical protein